MDTITIVISDGVRATINYKNNMNVQQALEETYPNIKFGLQYYGPTLGYMVIMIDGVFDNPKENPGYYWALLINDKYATKGIDQTILLAGQEVEFVNEPYEATSHAQTHVQVKYENAMLE